MGTPARTRSLGPDPPWRPRRPASGAVRITSPGKRSIDIVIFPGSRGRTVLEEASTFAFAETDVPVASASSLALLKLYAGGPKDAWDIRALLDSQDEPDSLRAEVDARIESMPVECRRLWTRLRRPE